MRILKYQKKHELTLYTVMWLTIYLAPIVTLYVHTLTESDVVFEWSEVLHEWKYISGFFVVFLIHNFLVSPLLVYNKRRMAYFSIMASVFTAFAVWQCVSRPVPDKPHEEPMVSEHNEKRDPPPPLSDGNEPFHGDSHGERTDLPTPRALPPKHKPEPPLFSGQQDLMAMLFMLATVGINVYMKYYFRFADERKRLKEIEKQNLEHQLEYLKYQINPHFFMNTLNNIHALVDIDPEKAKTTIVELSKLMRFVLYEASKPSVPLQREVDFVRNYIRLMRIRYADTVKINIKVSEPIPEREITPLITIAFVENAFKHGISYNHDSFISVDFKFTDDHLLFTCYNSKNETTEDKHGGVGLENVRQRLKLIYGDTHSLSINEDNDTYRVELTLPLT